MDTETAVREAIREHNSDLMIRSIACATIGCIGTFIAIFLVMVLFSRSALRSNTGLVEIGLFCGVLFCSGAVAAFLSKDGIRSASGELEEEIDPASQSLMSWVLFPQKPALVLLAWGAFGPYALVEATLMLRGRLSARDDVVRGCAETLRLLASDRAMPLAAIFQPGVARTLLCLAFVKPQARSAPPAIVITEKGRDTVLGQWRPLP